MVYLSLEAYTHPRTIELIFRMFDAWNWWANQYFAPLADQRKLIELTRKLGLLPWLARLADRDINRNTREEVNIYTYRTPDGMLSSAQDYRKGYGGDRQIHLAGQPGTRSGVLWHPPGQTSGRLAQLLDRVGQPAARWPV